MAYELFIRRVFPRFYGVRFYRYLFPIAGFAIVGLAVPVALAYRKLSLLLAFIHGLEILRTTLLLFFIGLIILMGRRWMRYEFGIALGLGLQASADLITSAAWARFWLASHLFDRLPLYAFHLACLVWLITFLKSEQPELAPRPALGFGILHQARIWEQSLRESLTDNKSL